MSAEQAYHPNPKLNGLMVLMERSCGCFNAISADVLSAMPEEVRREFQDTVIEGEKGFQRASEACDPAQKVLVGALYLSHALKEWREVGMVRGEDGE